MARMANCKVEEEPGCGFMGEILQQYRCNWLKKSSVYSIPTNKNNDDKILKLSNSCDSPKKQRRKSLKSEAKMKEPANFAKSSPKLDQNFTTKSTFSNSKPLTPHRNSEVRRHSDAARISTSSNETKPPVRPRSSTSSMILGQVGNSRVQGSGNMSANNSPRMTSWILGNIVRKNSREFRGLGSGLDPDMLMSMGNEAYKQGRYQEALELYDKAIGSGSDKAVYHSNKSAALIGLDRVFEAVKECKLAIKLEPSYHKAHRRLATLYSRLGETEKALQHLKQSGPQMDSKDMDKVQMLHNCQIKCTEAQKLEDWNTLLKETQRAISFGANSSPKIYALQAEALLRLQRHPEAYAAYQKGRKFSISSITDFFSLPNCIYLLMIETEVFMTMGRFEDALRAVELAAQLDPSNKEVCKVVKRARVVSLARSSGNSLFRASKFFEACVVYGEGLKHDPYNSVLLCNRAACRSKLGQFEKAVEDCTAALYIQPSYTKARLRRANCNVNLERWEAVIQDYEVLIRETPGNEEVGRALFEAQIQIKKKRGEDVNDAKFGLDLVSVSSSEHFSQFVTSPGMTVVLFCSKNDHKKVIQVLENVCKRFPSVNFLKVEIEEHPYLAKSEGVSSIPAFKIYKDGTRIEEIPGNNHDMLESSVRLYCR